MELTNPFVCTRLVKSVTLYAFIVVSSGFAKLVKAQMATAPVPVVSSFNDRLNAAPILFTENNGQVVDKAGILRPDVLFTAHSNGAKIYLTATGIYYQFQRTILPEGYEQDERKVKNREKQETLRKKIETQTSRFTLFLKGANPAPTIRREAKDAYTENFYLANCTITGVHTYKRIVYENVYPGIDWVIYSKAKGMEYDFIVHPGANPNLIKLDIKDAKKVSIAADGGLVMATELGEVKEAAPVSYCNNTEVVTAFNQDADGTIGFAVTPWNRSKELRIDPSVTWATYYGGSDEEYGSSCAVDAAGNIYLTGITSSTSGIASGGFQNTSLGGQDVYLVKLSSSGARLWATYYGGSGNELGYSCATDALGNVYVAGITGGSFSGIAFNGFQNNYGGGPADAFLVKFSGSGIRLWATYYGDGFIDSGNFCAIDASGNVYLIGGTGFSTTSTSNIPFGGFQNTYGGGASDGFLVKFNSSGARLWGTYYGGTGYEEGSSCTIDAADNIYITGFTTSTSSIASGSFQNAYGGGNGDAFLVKFNSSGARLWATYYGGSGDDYGGSCATDASDNIYMIGLTNSNANIASGGFQNAYGGGNEDVYLVKFSSSGARHWATYYGGSGDEYDGSCAMDASGSVYLAGQTNSTSGITSGGLQNTFGGGQNDAFLVKFSSSGARHWATYYGGSDDDNGSSCVVDALGNVCLAGGTSSIDGIASGGFQNTLGGSSDAFLAKINDSNVSGFTSIANGNWNNPAIWSGGIIPSASSIVIINTAVTITANTSCYSLTVNPTASVTVSPGINLTVLH